MYQGECGRQPWPAKIVLVATHADLLTTEDSETAKGPEAALAFAKQQFWRDFDIIDHVFVLDAHLAMSPELKMLRNQLGQAKSRIVKVGSHFLIYSYTLNSGIFDYYAQKQ